MLKMKQIDNFLPFARKVDSTSVIKNSSYAVAYTRVSSKEQELGYSLETQRKAIEEYAQRNNLIIVEFFGGTSESAKSDERKEFKKMLSFLAKNKIGVSQILIYSVDRFSRSGANAIAIIDELRKQGINVNAVTQPTDTSTASGQLQQEIQLVFGKYDNELRKQKCVAGMKEKLSQGYWIQKVPLGYDQYTKHKEQHITINATGEILRQAFYWKANENMHNTEIMERLNALGVKVSHQQITEIFRNPFYCGIIRHNLLQGTVVQGKHPKLIPEELFLRLNPNDKKRQDIRYKTEFDHTPLKRFIKCGECGSGFAGYVVKKKGLHYYKCIKTGCKCNRRAEVLNSMFMDLLKSFRVLVPYIKVIKEEFIRIILKRTEINKENEKLYKSQLTELNKKVESLEEKYISGEIGKELFDKYSLKFKEEKKVIEENLENVKIDFSNLEKRVNKYIYLCLNLASLWKRSSFQMKKKIQKLVFPEGIIYDRENNDFRTIKVNDAIAGIARLSSIWEWLETEKTATMDGFSGLVGATGFEPVTPCL